MTGLTRALAHYVCSSEFHALRPEIQHEGVRAFVNWIGGAASGSREDGVQKAIEALSEFSGSGSCVIVGRTERLDPLSAAFVNSMSSGILTFNDTHFRTVAHPTSSVAAALRSVRRSTVKTSSTRSFSAMRSSAASATSSSRRRQNAESDCR
jgi:2-methylcitrate dehydratase PrpD